MTSFSIADVVEMPVWWRKGILQGHVRVPESGNRTQIYRVRAKLFFEAIGEEGNAIDAGADPIPSKSN
jgi:hypothetical protein